MSIKKEERKAAQQHCRCCEKMNVWRSFFSDVFKDSTKKLKYNGGIVYKTHSDEMYLKNIITNFVPFHIYEVIFVS